MIIDNDTNFVLFSGLLESDPCFSGSYKRITAILDKTNVRYDIITGTNDIWARDYMPIQLGVNEFVQFRYEPSYLRNEPEHRSDPHIVCPLNGLNPEYSEINIDGGNVIRWHDKIIISDRIYTENPKHTDKRELVEEISRKLKTEVIIIPKVNSDFTGHADGMVRFYNAETILGNDRKTEYTYWVKAMNKILEATHLNYIDMPMFEYHDSPGSAIGCYVNYLGIGDLIIFPIFEVKGNKDKEAVDLINSLYPDKKIETININEIAAYGGLMNCISWNIKK